MITEDCTRLRQLMASLKSAERNEELVRDLSGRKENLKTLRDRFRQSADRVLPLKSRRVELGQLPLAEGNKALTRLETMRDKLAENPEGITKGRDFSTLVKSFEKLSSTFDDVVNDVWKPYADRQSPSVDSAQLQQCRRSHKSVVEELSLIHI